MSKWKRNVERNIKVTASDTTYTVTYHSRAQILPAVPSPYLSARGCSCNLITITQAQTQTDYVAKININRERTTKRTTGRTAKCFEATTASWSSVFVAASLPLPSPSVSLSACAILLNKCAKKCITFSKCQMSDKKPTERGCAALCASHSAYTWQSLFSDTLNSLPYLPLSLFLSLTFFSLLISLLLPHSFWLSAWIFNKQAAKKSTEGKNRVCVGVNVSSKI